MGFCRSHRIDRFEFHAKSQRGLFSSPFWPSMAYTDGRGHVIFDGLRNAGMHGTAGGENDSVCYRKRETLRAQPNRSTRRTICPVACATAVENERAFQSRALFEAAFLPAEIR